MSDDEEDTICPLCSEEMDLSDKNFLPCPCGYRVNILNTSINSVSNIYRCYRRFVYGVGTIFEIT